MRSTFSRFKNDLTGSNSCAFVQSTASRSDGSRQSGGTESDLANLMFLMKLEVGDAAQDAHSLITCCPN